MRDGIDARAYQYSTADQNPTNSPNYFSYELAGELAALPRTEPAHAIALQIGQTELQAMMKGLLKGLARLFVAGKAGCCQQIWIGKCLRIGVNGLCGKQNVPSHQVVEMVRARRRRKISRAGSQSLTGRANDVHCTLLIPDHLSLKLLDLTRLRRVQDARSS